VHLICQHKSIIVGGCVRSFFQANGTSTYGSNYIVCFKYFLIVSVQYISYGGFQIKIYKLVAVIVYARLKSKSWFIAKTHLVQYHWGLGIMYWDGELIISPIRMWQPPQLYRWCPFDYRYTWLKGGPRGYVFGILRLKHSATVVLSWTIKFTLLGYFVYG
jgi:hypothetical protein